MNITGVLLTVNSLMGMHTMAKYVKALINHKILKWMREKRINVTIDYSAEKLDVKPEKLKA